MGPVLGVLAHMHALAAGVRVYKTRVGGKRARKDARCGDMSAQETMRTCGSRVSSASNVTVAQTSRHVLYIYTDLYNKYI
jgi:hypothetical protein